MAGETDLQKMLATLTVQRRPSTYAIVSITSDPGVPLLGSGIEAVLAESEGTTVVCTVEVARRNRWPVEFEAAWLTLDVHSSLDAVGLTAAFSTALAGAGIPCNVLAGFFHDHILVPADQADEAIASLESLRLS